MVSLCSILRDASSFQPSSLRMPDTLTIPRAPFAHLAACLWTLSSLSTSRLRTGSQIAPQYSIGDLTREVYAISLCLYGLPLRFLFFYKTKPLVGLCRCLFNVCGPFEVVCQCDAQVLQLCCCCENFIVQLVKGWRLCFPICMTWHFFVLKRIPQHCPQRLSASRSCWRSSWACSESIDL